MHRDAFWCLESYTYTHLSCNYRSKLNAKPKSLPAYNFWHISKVNFIKFKQWSSHSKWEKITGFPPIKRKSHVTLLIIEINRISTFSSFLSSQLRIWAFSLGKTLANYTVFGYTSKLSVPFARSCNLNNYFITVLNFV